MRNMRSIRKIDKTGETEIKGKISIIRNIVNKAKIGNT